MEVPIMGWAWVAKSFSRENLQMAKSGRKLFTVTVIVGSLLLATASLADADDGGLNFSLGVGVPGLSAQVSNYPSPYYASPSYYYAPPPPPPPPPAVVYGPPAPVYYAPPPPRRGPPPWAGVWRH